MSGVINSAKKVFRKVTDVVSVVAPAALAAGAILFTAGSALGISGMAGGWSGAVKDVVSRLGATEMLGSVLEGAIEKAGYGALAGAGIAAVTGGSVRKGLLYGAGTGALAGGIQGGIEYDPTAATQATSVPMASQTGTEVQSLGPLEDQAGMELKPGGGFQSVGGPASQVAAGPAGGVTQQVAGNAAPRTGLWGAVERNGTAIGGALSGVAQGALKGLGSGDEAEALLKKQQNDQAYVAGNYASSGRGLLKQEDVAYVGAQNGQRPTPGQKFDPRTYGGSYAFDPTLGRIVFIPNQAT